MERYFMLDKFNTWYDWSLVLTAKDVTAPEPKTNYVELDGMSGTLDLTQALTGEVTYKDRTISASFWTSEGTANDRAKLVRDITTALHGKRIKIIEPDDQEHYFNGRVIVKGVNNTRSYLEFTIEATCEPWRYAVNESERLVTVSGTSVNTIVNNDGVKTVTPSITVTGSITLTFDGATYTLTAGVYKIANIKFKQGTNIIGVSGTGSVAFNYREADL